MEGKVVMMCAVIGFFGLLSVILGFAAEGTRAEPDQLYADDNLECTFPKSTATVLGALALLAIILSEIITSVATRCICCCKRGPQPTSCDWTVGQVCFVFSWVSVAIAAVLLVWGSVTNNSQQTTITGDNYVECYFVTVKPGIFAGGGIMSLASVVCGLFAYILTQGKNSPVGQPQFQAGSPNQGGIAMGQPQPQYQWGNQGGVPAGPIEFPPQGPARTCIV